MKKCDVFVKHLISISHMVIVYFLNWLPNMKTSSVIVCLFLFFTHHITHAKTLVSSKERPIMLELYSSQGCSSCPPAEAWLNKFKTDPRLWKTLIPINFHVDYWDYLGWNDPYADNKFSKRQRNYKRFGHTNYIATPGFIVDGKGWNGWFSKQTLPINQQATSDKLTVNLENDTADVTFMSIQQSDEPVTITVAILGFDQRTFVKRGENKGDVLKHDFVVLNHTKTTIDTKNFSYKANIPLPDTSKFDSSQRAIVVWVSNNRDPRPIQVVADWL